jgi:hypothetical protein
MKFNVLVVDDEINDRRAAYSDFAAVIPKLVPGFDVEFTFVESPEAMASVLQGRRFAGAIVDAVLNLNWPVKFDLPFVLSKLSDSIPVALVSAQWDKTNANELNFAWKQSNVRTFVHWRDITGGISGDRKYAVASLVGMLADGCGLSLGVELEPDEDLRILHVSDLQIGGVKQAKLRQEADNMAYSVREKLKGQSPAFLAVTGDIAEHGWPSEFRGARDWLEYFMEALGLGGLPSDRLLLVPGNHDVNLALSGSARVETAKAEDGATRLLPELSQTVFSKELLRYAYEPFLDFANRVTTVRVLADWKESPSFPWVHLTYLHLGVGFYGVNTCYRADGFGVPERVVEEDALTAIGRELGQVCAKAEPGALIIGMGHHCPTSAHGDRSVSNPEAFRRHFRGPGKTALFLHGHVHTHDIEYVSGAGTRLVRSCASTIAKDNEKRPPDSLRGFNLISLRREDGIVAGMEAVAFGLANETFSELQRRSFDRGADGQFWEEVPKPSLS